MRDQHPTLIIIICQQEVVCLLICEKGFLGFTFKIVCSFVHHAGNFGLTLQLHQLLFVVRRPRCEPGKLIFREDIT